MPGFFVSPESIVRKIWGKADTVLFIFAGAAAEFALNKAVDWLYFTGHLPAQPLERLFSTVTYARQIIFSEHDAALAAIDKIAAIHHDVEKKRGMQIPDWAYRDVLFLLIDYSIRSFELLERELTDIEKQDVFEVFYRVGDRMKLKDLPPNYGLWVPIRDQHMQHDLASSNFTVDLYVQYKKHLGNSRYNILRQVQLLLVPARVSNLLMPGIKIWMVPFLKAYKLCRLIKIDGILKSALLPSEYKKQIKSLDLAE